MSISKFLLLSLAVSSLLSAQVPPIPGLTQGGANAEEEQGDTPPANLTQALSKPDPDAPYPGGLEFPNATAHDLVAVYQNVTGKRVLVPSALKDVQFTFLQGPGMTNQEVADLLEKFLMLEGYQLNPDLRNPNIVTLLGTNQPGGPATAAEPVRVVTEPSQLALEQGVVSYVMRFQYLKPEEAQRAFTQVFGQLRPGGTISEVRNASSLIITEKAALIQNLLKLKDEIDVPSARVGTEWVEVEYADVQELAEQLNEMFNAQQSNQQSARVQRQQQAQPANTPPIPGLAANGAAGGTAEGGGEESPPTITPDSRTNRIFLMGRPVDLVFIKQLIAQWDVPTSKRNFLKRKLRYLPVYEFLPIAESAISSTMSEAVAGGGGSAGGARSTANANNRSLGQNNTNSNNNSNTGFGGGAGGGTGSSTASLSGSDRPTQPESILVGQTLLVTDNVANSIIVQGPPHHIEMVEGLIDELDVKNEQVAISAVFGRFSVTDGLTFGTNLGRLLNGNGIGFATNNGGGGGIIENNAITEFANLVTPGAGLAAAGIDGDFGAFINAVETYTNFQSFARPTIFTTNNKEARISSGTQIAIPTNTYQGLNGSSGQSTNVEYRDVALELLVRPLVNSADEVTLEISIVRDTVGEDRNVGELIIPDLLSDQLDTIVTVPVGAAVLLGGLIEEDTNDSEGGVPILRAIPLVGNFFKNIDDQFRRSELVIMIRPTIVDGKVAIQQYQDVYDYSSNLSGKARQQFTAPEYQPRVNSAVDKVFGKPKPVQQQAPQERMPMSPLQQAIYDKKRRQEAARQK
ncbi:secretin N-terminal domain-containing protein [Roseibacillus ishigakijimensis]|uniref:Type II secretion system protein D n=1 Tax=Roseibacillus ishigakijimensis TaxID=454146 RepID=A0A934VKQ7_9BACT|nr:secretin N-terminal domain-containing protein [Roseibacillus ishigakijimensis]MBK1833899.1 hypothetical protein [Roseibacillus ishigakijimensis]